MPAASEKVPLSREAIEEALTEIDGWAHKGQVIERIFKTGNFSDGVALVNEIAVEADKANHHPDVFITFPKVKVQLMTHEVSGITKLDLALASKINAIALSQGIY